MNRKVIIAPLNWGLGHATRCIPLINSFLNNDWEVILSSDGEALALLKKEFPTLTTYDLSSYKIKYPFKNALLNMAVNASSMFKAILNEKKEIAQIIEKENADLLISDNRYGVHKKGIKSVFIGHQLKLKAGNIFLSRIASFINKLLIRRFDEVWVPDYKDERALAPGLSNVKTGVRTKYLGPLSRFEKSEEELEYDLCAIISGPEPQKSHFKELLIQQLSQLVENVVIISGDLNDDSDIMYNQHTRIVGFLTSNELNKMINKSKVIIARSGYSTIMDMVKLEKKAILIPTPGQTEQEYIASHLGSNPQFVFQNEKDLDIPEAIKILNLSCGNSRMNTGFDVSNYL